MGKVFEVLGQSDFVTSLILIVILILSVGSWAVAIAKLKEFRKVLSSSRLFMDEIGSASFWEKV